MAETTHALKEGKLIGFQPRNLPNARYQLTHKSGRFPIGQGKRSSFAHATVIGGLQKGPIGTSMLVKHFYLADKLSCTVTMKQSACGETHDEERRVDQDLNSSLL